MQPDLQTALNQKHDVERVLSRVQAAGASVQLSDAELQVLLSPSADAWLEPMARLAADITRQRFGRIMQLYAPLYLSNTCMSTCTYCGFSFENKTPRRTLHSTEIQTEAEYLHKEGIRHILLLTGESYRDTPLAYLRKAIADLKERFSAVSIEVYPLKTDEYRELRAAGLDGLTIYQETYDPERYAQVHLRGMKKRMQYRLECPDRAGIAGVRKLVIGALAGLSDPAADVYVLARHARYLLHQYWQSRVSVSLPRLRPAEGLQDPSIPGIPDRDYVRYLCALRLYLPDAGIYLSTRESSRMRDHMARICITDMSAGSKTDPGGYALEGSTEQFSIDDTRSVAELGADLRRQDLDVILNDWAALLV
ncbi:MAG: 2-iminoacetate synthase ThiH [Leptospiraceae bacterium]|nr:2-iminoacetate synthase ThiH [Leptospiraceae bacterium]